MKQVLQHLRSGLLEIADLPSPKCSRGKVLIHTRASLISAGTERMLVEFGKANMWQKARSQPEKVKQVLEKFQTDGLLPTVEAVLRKLDQPLPLGYSNAGVVVEVGAGVTDLKPGDRVASNGHHAELIAVPRNLCAKIPHSVTDEHAAFTTVGSIALQGVRLIQPTFGERIMVFGVGLLGLLTIQLLTANGCEVLAVDLNTDRLNLAKQFGAEVVDLSQGGDPIAHAEAWSHGMGVDGAILTASAETDEIVHQAAQACRKRGRIVLVGVVGLNLRRSDFFEKELTFQVSCSYGPGRYDAKYEQQGHDYPHGFVRWTEQRNFEAVLQAMHTQRIQIDPLITHRFPIAQATQAYDTIRSDKEALGVLLEYPKKTTSSSPEMIITPRAKRVYGEVKIGVVGMGNFSMSTLLPALSKTSAHIDTVVDRKPFAARHAASKFKVHRALTNHTDLLSDPKVDAVFFVTQHNAHAAQVCEALQAGKHVFVEKPLALNESQLQTIIRQARKSPEQLLMVGFNRRFSPHIQHIKKQLRGRSGPLCMQMTVNAGAIPPEHWVQQPEAGGGRIIGEACHFIDLVSYLAESPIVSVSAMMVGPSVAVQEDKMSIMLQMEDGSIGTVHYFANGTKAFPKENLEIFSDQRVIRMENYRTTTGYGFQNFPKLRSIRQDKGHQAECEAFIQAIQQGTSSPISFAELINVTRASFAAVESAKESRTIQLSHSLELPEDNESSTPDTEVKQSEEDVQTESSTTEESTLQ